MQYAKEALDIATRENNKRYIARSLFQIANMYHSRDSLKLSMDYYLRSVRMAEEIKDSIIVFENYNNIGVIYRVWGSYNRALENYSKAYNYPGAHAGAEILQPVILIWG